MKSHVALMLAGASLVACSLAQAEGFTAYFVQRMDNGRLSTKVTCEVLNVPGPQLRALQVLTPKEEAKDWDGKPVPSAVILANGFTVPASWNAADGCSNEGVPRPVPAALSKLPS